METAWKKYSVLLKYIDREKYPPNESFLVSLADHIIKSEHNPSIEILLNGQCISKISFNIVVSLTLNGFILKVQNGKIMEVNTGTCRGKGTLKCEKIVVLEKETQSITLPGNIKLGEGIPIVP